MLAKNKNLMLNLKKIVTKLKEKILKTTKELQKKNLYLIVKKFGLIRDLIAQNWFTLKQFISGDNINRNGEKVKSHQTVISFV